MNDECVIWTGQTNGAGLPQQNTGKSRSARRVIYMEARGPVKRNDRILMSCLNALCVNPDHMRKLSCSEMMKELHGRADTKARISLAVRKRSKLTAEQAYEIRARRAAGEFLKDIAKDYGIHPSLVSRIAIGELWREPSPFSA